MSRAILQRLAAVVGMCVAAHAPGGAQATVHGTTLPDAIATALRRNADVLTAAAVVDSARAERGIASSYPNPTLAGQPNTPYQYAVSLPLDVTPRRYYRTRSAALGVAAANADRLDVRRQTTLAVARAFLDALLADRQRVLSLERRAAVLQLLQADSARFRSGDIPEHALARSEIELARADADVERAAIDVVHSRFALQALMGVEHPDTAFAAIGSLEYHAVDVIEDTLLASARTHRPDLQGAMQRVQQSAATEHAAAALRYPTPELSYVRQFGAPFDNGHYYSFGLAFELPSLNLYRGERQRAEAGAAVATLAERRLDTQIQRDVRVAVSDFRLQRALVERYQSGLMPKIDATVSAARYAYSRGAASLLEVLDALHAQQDIQAEYATALHDYWVSVYTLGAAAGTGLYGVPPID